MFAKLLFLSRLQVVIVMAGSFLSVATVAGSLVTSNKQLDSGAHCNAVKTLTFEGYDTEIISAEYVSRREQSASVTAAAAASQDFIPFCNLKGFFEKRIGVDDKPYAIGFGIALPDNWNGRFLFQGGGGLNGLIREPLGALAAGDIPALSRGFVVVSTDSGHQSESRFDPDFFEDQQSLLNFHSQAVVKTTKLAQKVVTQFYGKAPTHSYFVGCSTGGREAMTMSQRYPLLYDGIIAGAPARRTNYSEIADLWSAKTLQGASEDGQSSPFNSEQQQLIIDSLLQQCDALDGLSDNMIFDVEGCNFDPYLLQCPDATASDDCLSAEQISALQTALAGPKHPDGKNVYPGFFYDTGIAENHGGAAPGLLQAVPGPLGRVRVNQPFDLQRELAIADGFPLEPGNATWTNLSSFALAGHKIIFYHGVSDPWFSAIDTLNYYREMSGASGGHEAVTQWSQLYLVPGMGHCGGGKQALDKFDLLSALVSWVEQGDRPAAVNAYGQAFPSRTRKLCPYPQVSYFKGKGDSEAADSFECR